MDKKFIVSSSPHIRGPYTTQGIMKDVLIALTPAMIVAVYFLGIRSLLVTLVTVASCIFFEAIWQKINKQPMSVGDLSAVVTGVLLAFNLPAYIPIYIPIIGAFVAIIVAKQFFGGIGQNFINPALGARAVLLASFPVAMTDFSIPGMDAISGATPIELMRAKEIAPTLMDVFIGNIGGSIGEISALALLLGLAYLVFRKVITLRIPAVYVGTVFILTYILGTISHITINPLYEVMAGGLFLGAFFMATDYSTSPATPKGEIIFALGCGIITTVIRLYGGYPEGVSYAILIMNLTVPLIDKYTVPRPFGAVKKA
ncbi:MAG TPA: RnfABCDGE type electron transport complex subunit D [Epulopiscium sp.]|nr:RnfABCDGE type electron transport complex subunit D [Candidatus Epulonipiscium sp.]